MDADETDAMRATLAGWLLGPGGTTREAELLQIRVVRLIWEAAWCAARAYYRRAGQRPEERDDG